MAVNKKLSYEFQSHITNSITIRKADIDILHQAGNTLTGGDAGSGRLSVGGSRWTGIAVVTVRLGLVRSWAARHTCERVIVVRIASITWRYKERALHTHEQVHHT